MHDFPLELLLRRASWQQSALSWHGERPVVGHRMRGWCVDDLQNTFSLRLGAALCFCRLRTSASSPPDLTRGPLNYRKNIIPIEFSISIAALTRSCSMISSHPS